MAGINRSRLFDVGRLDYYYYLLLWYTIHTHVLFRACRVLRHNVCRPGHELGVHSAKAVLESRVTRERITNNRKLPRCWMK